MRLVFVHGRDQQGKDPKKLQKEWEAALRRGLKKINAKLTAAVDIAFPYYGDRLHKLVKQVDAPLITGVVTRGAPIGKAEMEFRAAMLLEIARRAGVTNNHIAQHYDGATRQRGLQNARWVLAIARALDRTPMAGTVVDRLTRDVYVYLTYPGVREWIDKIVAKELYKGPCVVVAHSLGSVVAYQVLRNAPKDLNVSLYQTVGSPLALKAIQAKLGYPASPDCAARWFNGRDRQDIVALYPLDARHFSTTPPIVNLSTIKNHTSNHHGIEGYLDHPTVAQEILDALTRLPAIRGRDRR